MQRAMLMAAWVIGLLVFGVGTPARAAGWLKAESDHFVIYTDGSEAKAREYVRQLEAFRYVSLMVLGADGASARAKAKFDIYLLRKQLDMQKVRPDFQEAVAGVYFQCVEGSSAYSTLQPFQRPDGSDHGLIVLFHEYAHRLMFQYAAGVYPSWYIEGFAEYMSTAAIEDSGVSIGEPFTDRLRILGRRPWISFEQVLKPSFKLRSGDDSVGSFYAQSWLLAHYMLNDSGRTQKFNAYFERVGGGEDAVAAFEPATGIPVARLYGILKRYAEALPVIRVSGQNLPKASVKIDALPEDANDYLLSASVLKSCPPKPHGEAILAKLRALPRGANSTSPMQLALARAELLFGDAKAAHELLEAYLAADDNSFEAHYLMGRAEAKLADPSQARAHFFKAYRLKKNDAPNLYHLAQTLALNGVNANVLNAAQGAHALEPTVPDYAIYEALADLEANDRERAAAALLPLSSNPHDPKQAARMRSAIEAIKAGKSKSEVSNVIDADKQTP